MKKLEGKYHKHCSDADYRRKIVRSVWAVRALREMVFVTMDYASVYSTTTLSHNSNSQ